LVHRATLKKRWTCPRGCTYEAGSVFVRKNLPNNTGRPGAWYDYTCPGKSYGFVFISYRIFRIPSAEERELKAIRLLERSKIRPLDMLLAGADR
jgi:hypothetical protein